MHVISGRTGTGKTECARAYFHTKYGENFFFWHPSEGTEWWDFYEGQPALVIDEFDGFRHVSYKRLLAILDRYFLPVPVKGSFLIAAWTEVIITSDRPWDHWYPDISDKSELNRRLNGKRIDVDKKVPTGSFLDWRDHFSVAPSMEELPPSDDGDTELDRNNNNNN